MTDFEAVIRAFGEAGVEFVIVGGLAATIHGSATTIVRHDPVGNRLDKPASMHLWFDRTKLAII